MNLDAALDGVGHRGVVVLVARAHRSVLGLAGVALPEVAAAPALGRVGLRRRRGRHGRRGRRLLRGRRRVRRLFRGRGGCIVLCQDYELKLVSLQGVLFDMVCNAKSYKDDIAPGHEHLSEQNGMVKEWFGTIFC